MGKGSKSNVLYDYTRPMSYFNKEAAKVPGPTNYFKGTNPKTNFAFENAGIDPSVLQGKNAPAFS